MDHAIALLGLATLTLVLELWIGFTLVVDATRFIQHDGFVNGLSQAAPFDLVFGAVFAVLLGARKMMTLRSYRLAKTAAILSLDQLVDSHPGLKIDIAILNADSTGSNGS